MQCDRCGVGRLDPPGTEVVIGISATTVAHDTLRVGEYLWVRIKPASVAVGAGVKWAVGLRWLMELGCGHGKSKAP